MTHDEDDKDEDVADNEEDNNIEVNDHNSDEKGAAVTLKLNFLFSFSILQWRESRLQSLVSEKKNHAQMSLFHKRARLTKSRTCVHPSSLRTRLEPISLFSPVQSLELPTSHIKPWPQG